MTKPTRPPDLETPPITEGGFVLDTTRPTAPQILCYVSNDGGMTWSAAPSRSLGGIGEYRQRVKWHRLGSAENIVLRFSCSEPVPLAVLNCEIEAEGAAS